ncbi:MAG: Gfo/Idh/MocA family oxidoreductase, partial [Candidatus Hydrogenedentes bacterium]|nr:Gfo/Idh/MocA family oxidoreductase [Candidatus Hydrogenedentota bacterium]
MATAKVPSRRTFLKISSAATISALAPVTAFGANERINFGVIGCGGMGTGHVGSLVGKSEADNIKVVAVCDVYTRRINRAKDICQGEGFSDYRKLLERPDVDAVLIATPDHWHAKIAMDAIAAGKHVYCEKPMTHTVEQAIELRNVVRNSDRVFQVGPQGAGNDSFWKGRDAIQAGRIGKVTWAHGAYNRNARICLFNEHQKIDPTAGPDKSGDDYIDWDMWLGWKWGL